MRIEARALRRREFVRAAQALGVPPVTIAWRHVLPHAATVAVSGTSIVFGGAIITEASLAFVGLGDKGVTSLGQLAANGFAFVTLAPWAWIAPVAALALSAGLVAVLTDRPSEAARAGQG